MNFEPLETYQVLANKHVKTYEIIQFHFKKILQGIYRRLTFKQKFKNPWVAEVGEYICPEVFYEYYKAIRDFKISFGRTTEVKRNKQGKPTSYTIKFNHLGCMNFHLKKSIDGSSTDEYLKKQITLEIKLKLLWMIITRLF